jgi:CheY-like chemotaxis protein
MVKPNILVVDSDEGFGMMLAEGLQNSGKYSAKLVTSGGDALQSIVETQYDLVIIDIAIPDIKPPTLIKAIREAKSDLKIMMTPPIGQDLPAGLKKLNLDGVLPKPFFVGDLPDLVDRAMGVTRQRPPTPMPMPVQSSPPQTDTRMPPPAAAPVVSPQGGVAEPALPSTRVPPPFVPQETIRFLRASETEILKLLHDLNREVRAEAILLIVGHDLIANSGMLSKEECADLAILVAQSSQTASQAASFLGERAGRFTQSLHEGGAYRLYTLTLSEGILLSLALSTNVPLGMIRHQSRQIAEQLSKFII